MDTIFLTGFMATGKTVVGRALARRLGRKFVDLDEEIERAAGLTVAEIFARFGEAEFRSRECAALSRVARMNGAVVATGGGAVIDPRNRAAMRAGGKLVCLTADPRVILDRLGPGAERPLLADAADREQKVRSLLAERAAAYADHDLAIDTSERSPGETVETIRAWLEKASRREGGAGKAPVG